MFTDMISKRAFLKAAGAGFATSLLPRQSEAFARTEAVFAANFMAEDKSFGVALLTEAGHEITRLARPARGHDVSFDPVSSRAVAFARRPGTYALVFDTTTGQSPGDWPHIDKFRARSSPTTTSPTPTRRGSA